MAMNKVFVYGTLKKGRSNHEAYMSHAKFVGEGKTSREMWGLMDFGAYPAMTYGQNKVRGEVYEVTEFELSRIDRLEGIDVGLYQRHMIEVEVDGQTYDCYTYLMFDAAVQSAYPVRLEVW